MMRAAHAMRGERGYSLVEVLLVSTLMLVVLGATLTSFNAFERTTRTNERQNEAQDKARRAMDLMARDLRNMASPTDEDPAAIDRMEATDLVFQSEGNETIPASLNETNTTRVRYCLDPSSGVLLRQRQVWVEAEPPAIPASSCGEGWDQTLALTDHVVNGARPLFLYNDDDPRGVSEVSMTLFVDADVGRTPPEVTLQSSVFLRNQNRAPTAEFTWAPAPGNAVFLNASASVDPEEKPITYEWYDPEAEPPYLGGGVVKTYKPDTPGLRSVYLIVRDARLSTTSDPQTVCANGGVPICTPP